MVTLQDAAGQPVSDAVVTFEGQGSLPMDYGQPPKVRQEGLQFHPFVLAVPAGSAVEFPNLDRVRHHVYSFSKGNRFELELYGREENRSVTFDKPGTVAIGCNIHDDMLAYIRVTDAPFGAVTDAAGQAELLDLPPDVASATVWHPMLAGGEAITVPLERSDDGLQLILPAAYPAPALHHKR